VGDIDLGTRLKSSIVVDCRLVDLGGWVRVTASASLRHSPKACTSEPVPWSR
jgi:hypothetical protein